MKATAAPVITLCGSTKFKDAINAENARLTMEGNVVISLGLFGHTDLPDYDWSTDASDLKRTLDGLHFQKIDMADRVHVVNVGGYYGESTAREIGYALAQGKAVSYMVPTLSPDCAPIPQAEQCEGDCDSMFCTKRGTASSRLETER
jgi:hypothetical protein